jgi:adenine C2-methylase RlmN of 23S rRNA A2503 and tRNA A37
MVMGVNGCFRGSSVWLWGLMDASEAQMYGYGGEWTVFVQSLMRCSFCKTTNGRRVLPPSRNQYG